MHVQTGGNAFGVALQESTDKIRDPSAWMTVRIDLVDRLSLSGTRSVDVSSVSCLVDPPVRGVDQSLEVGRLTIWRTDGFSHARTR